jgi:hypothetical protein
MKRFTHNFVWMASELAVLVVVVVVVALNALQRARQPLLRCRWPARCLRNRSTSSDMLAIARTTLIQKVRLYEIPRPRKPDDPGRRSTIDCAHNLTAERTSSPPSHRGGRPIYVTCTTSRHGTAVALALTGAAAFMKQ